MHIVCNHCGSGYEIEPPASARGRSFRFRCSVCGRAFPVKLEPETQSRPAPSSAEPATNEEPRGMLLKQEGKIYRVRDAATLQRWIAERRVLPEDLLSVGGSRWEPVASRPEFEVFFRLLHQAERAVVPPPAEFPLADASVAAGMEGQTGRVPVPETAQAPAEPGEIRSEPADRLEDQALEERDDERAGSTKGLRMSLSEPVRASAPAIDDGSDYADEPTRPLNPLKLPVGPDDPTVEIRRDQQARLFANEPTRAVSAEDREQEALDVPAYDAYDTAGQADIDDLEWVRRKRRRRWVAVAVVLILFIGGAGTWSYVQFSDEAPDHDAVATVSGGTTGPAAPSGAGRTAEESSSRPEASAEPAPPAAPSTPKAAPAKSEAAAPKARAVAKAGVKPASSQASARKANRRSSSTAGRVASSDSWLSALISEGWEAAGRGDYIGAKARFSQAVDISPTNALARYGLGYALQKLGDPDTAYQQACMARRYAHGDKDLTRELDGMLRQLGRTCP